MRLAIAQLDLTIGAFDANLAAIRDAVTRARAAGAELVVLSELATLGYPPGDLLERGDVIDANLRQLERIAALSDDRLAILCGFVDRNPASSGKALYNSAALCHRGVVAGRYRKCLLPTYDVFDEARHFEPGGAVRPLELGGVRLGVTVCEDVWVDPPAGGRRLYRRDPVAEVAAAGADLLINLSASPFELGKARVRREMISREAAEHRRFFVYVNQVGGNDELVFDGHSLIADPTGHVVVRARDFAPDLLVYDVPVGEPGPGPFVPGELREVAATAEDEAYRALVLGLGDYVRKTGFRRVVLGLSGGVDSALTAALACAALGPENVLGVALPSRHSSAGSLADAEALARNLGLEYRVIPIDPVFQAHLDALEPAFAGAASDVTEENLQARIRGAVLMALANKHGRLLLATGNKSELAVGYCTLYGDMCGALAVIGDVPKTLVYRIASHVNREREVIPVSTLTKPPSAELRPDQTDQDTLPPYDLLDRVVEAYVERRASVDDIVTEGIDREVVETVVRLIDASEYKRRQAAPAIKISGKAFGVGRRYPIVADYRALRG